MSKFFFLSIMTLSAKSITIIFVNFFIARKYHLFNVKYGEALRSSTRNILVKNSVLINTDMEKKLKLFLQLGFASTLVFCASALIGLTLALDSWRSATIVENKISTHYTQGIFKECIRNSTHKNVCHDWRVSKYAKEFYQFEELLLSLIVSSSACGGLSLLLSLAATTSRLPKLVLQVTVLELVSALLGIACLIIYTSQFIKEPWSPGLSYFCLWIGTIFMLIGLVTHTCVGDVKFYGRKFFIPPQPRYRYHKGSNTVVEL